MNTMQQPVNTISSLTVLGSSSNVVVKDNLTAPHTDEITLGFERELFADFSLAISGLWRESKHIFEDDEANLIWDQEGKDVIGHKSSEESYIWSSGYAQGGLEPILGYGGGGDQSLCRQLAVECFLYLFSC